MNKILFRTSKSCLRFKKNYLKGALSPFQLKKFFRFTVLKPMSIRSFHLIRYLPEYLAFSTGARPI